MKDPVIISFGGGVDSTALVAMHLNRDRACSILGIAGAQLDAALPDVDAVVFSDPGAEFPATYANIEVARGLCLEQGVGFEVVRRKSGSIVDWLARNGTVPTMVSSSHVCSLKFKGEVLHRWARETYPGREVVWLIGIEADEGKRVKRFQAQPAMKQNSRFPLVELGIDRTQAKRLVLELWPAPVRKSSCTFCPFMSEPEILEVAREHPEAWALAKRIEADFKATSPAKHQAWIDAGRPLQGESQRAPVGMWSQDSWAKGARLFAKSIAGRRLSVDEWEARAVG